MSLFPESSKRLSDILHREGNNFDLFRLLAAFGVIFGHAYAISPQPPLTDPVLRLVGFEYAGSISIKFFFFLSGLLVTDSLLRKPEPVRFLARRAFRIFPGLIACLLMSILVFGPLFTELPLKEYFLSRETWEYFYKNVFLYDMRWKLPGVFPASALGMNGSLWTLPLECLSYLYLAIGCALGLFYNRTVGNLILISIVALPFFAPQYLLQFSIGAEAYFLPTAFALGSLAAFNKEIIKIDLLRCVLLWILLFLIKEPALYRFVFYVAFLYSTLFVASLDFVKKYLRLPFDASYGVYIYGFTIQQMIHYLLPTMGLHRNQVMACFFALVAGIISWYLVEKPSIAFGAKITSKK